MDGTKIEANIINTVGTYDDTGKAKNHFAASLNTPTSSISVQSALVDRQHVNVEPLRDSLTIPRGQASCHIFPKNHHTLVTSLMDWEVPLDCGYGNKKNLVEFQDILATRYDEVLDKMYDPNPGSGYLLPGGIKPVEDLKKYGVMPNEVKLAASQAFAQDRDKIVQMGVPNDLLFPWSHVNSINLKQVEAFNKFISRFNPGDSQGLVNRPERASAWLKKALTEGLEVHQHYYAVEQILKPGSIELFVANKNHEAHMVAAENAINTVREFGGKVESELQRDYFARILYPRTLSDAEDIAMTTFHLRNPKRGCKSIFPGYHT